MKIKLTVVAAIFVSLFCSAEITLAQRGGFGRGSANSWLGLLRMHSVQKEIELVPDQQEQIDQLQKDMWSEMQDQMKDLRGLEPEERRERFADLREQMEERQVEYQEKIESVLLPLQVKRLKQLQIQSQSRRNGSGAVGVLKNRELMDELGIDAKTQEQLEEKAKEVREKLEEKIKKLRAEAEKEILSVLSSEQRNQLREMMGDSFDFDSARDFGGGRESRGSRGSRRSGRGGQEEDKSDR